MERRGPGAQAERIGGLLQRVSRPPLARWIGIGGCLTTPPLPHHRAYGSVPRRFDWVEREQKHRDGGDRVSPKSGCAAPAGPPCVLTCARIPSVERREPLHGMWGRHDGAVP